MTKILIVLTSAAKMGDKETGMQRLTSNVPVFCVLYAYSYHIITREYEYSNNVYLFTCKLS